MYCLEGGNTKNNEKTFLNRPGSLFSSESSNIYLGYIIAGISMEHNILPSKDIARVNTFKKRGRYAMLSDNKKEAICAKISSFPYFF